MNKVEPIRSKADLRKVEQILAKNPRDLLMFNIGTNCGLRISDILALNVGDVKGKNFIQLTEKKTGKFKKFPINAKLKPMFEKFTRGRSADEPLFMTKFKNRLIKANLIEYKCSCCGITEWNGKPLTLQLHHINGNNRDNRLENLTFLCPNCHSQTDNFSGKNAGK